jgi:hypothetical protein
VCINEGDHRRILEQMVRSVVCLGRLAEQATKPQVKREGKSVLVMPINSPVDLMFEHCENVAIVVASSSRCCWPAVRDMALCNIRL